ncbi:unnamed protein product [Tuber aestivum]|uniref:Uncharacterized protein n=1 Tax=Tuber aestivum TaxID=59557 RepID=A0A292Q891_9PEZI|nr:unnamed protein product [Tuber aestivum]
MTRDTLWRRALRLGELTGKKVSATGTISAVIIALNEAEVYIRPCSTGCCHVKSFIKFDIPLRRPYVPKVAQVSYRGKLLKLELLCPVSLITLIKARAVTRAAHE